MIMSKSSGLWAIDADDMDQWEQFAAEHKGQITPTAWQLSGRDGGGQHLVYERPEEADGWDDPALKQRPWSEQYPNIEVKSKGFIVVAPSAHHKTGRRYAWRGDGMSRPAEPGWPLLQARRAVWQQEYREVKVAERRDWLEADREAKRQLSDRDRQPLKLLTMGDVRSMPRPVDMVAGLIPAPVTGTSCIGTFFGASGAYKSFLMVHLGMCVDSGQPFLGQPVLLTGSSVLVLGEGQAGAGIRADAALDANPAFAGSRVHYVLGAFPLADARRPVS